MKKVLIIGSAGMLGQALMDVFRVDSDYEVVALTRNDLDITNETQVEEKIAELTPNIILNAAAYNAVDKAEESDEEFERAKKINGEALGFLAQAAKKVGAVFVHYSTDYVFDGRPPMEEPEGCTGSCGGCRLHEGLAPEIGFKEDAMPNPLSAYGESKLMGEEAVKEKGEKYYIIRLSKLFGKPGKSESSKKSFFDMMLELGRKNDEVKAVDEETSCFTYAPDLAKKTKEIIEAEKEFGIYHVTNSGAATWYEAVCELYDQVGLKTKVIAVCADEFPRAAERPFYSVLINKKLNPLRNYKEALKDYLVETGEIKK